MSDVCASPTPPRGRRPGVPRRILAERDFQALWVSDAVSQLGSQVTRFALPLLVVSTLGASAVQVGLLQAAYLAPFVALPLFAGVWLERRAKRPVMIAMDLGRAALVASVPLAAWCDVLSLTQLYAVALLVGAMTVGYDVAGSALVPELVGTPRLAGANGILAADQAAAATAGPGLAGWLVGVFGPPVTLLFDGVSYLVSAMALLFIRHQPTRSRRPAGPGLWRELAEGLHAVLGNPPVRALAGYAAGYNAISAVMSVAFLMYYIGQLEHSSASYGLVMMTGGVGAIAGSLGAPMIISRVGHGPALMPLLALSTCPYLLLPVAQGGSADALVCGVAFSLGAAGSAGATVVALTLRQRLTAPARYTRMTATYRLICFGASSVGFVVSGVAVTALGARTVLWLAPVALVASAVPALTRPVRSIRHVVEPEIHGGSIPEAPARVDAQ